MYKENPDIPIPLRTLNRWTAKKNVDNGNQDFGVLSLENEKRDGESSEENTSDNSYDQQRIDTSDKSENNDHYSASSINEVIGIEDEVIGDNFELIEPSCTITTEIQDDERQLIASAGFNYKNLNIYARVKIYNEIYTSTIYKAIKTNSFTVKIIQNCDSCIYGMIKFFFESESQLYFIVQCLAVNHEKMMIQTSTKTAVRHIIPVTESSKHLLIKLTEVKNICQLVCVGEYICKRPDQLKKVW
ncbi:Protein of unknown function [Cotesia congregata]|uniref:Uncharacterized protein n=1 Tax=Cotesia congregata TaxID=51543 RepID=A0A8J2E4W3_COTCN|nr:Protein of unknown function [Cotesia congregata]